MRLLLLLAIFALTGTFAAENEGTEIFRLLGHSWTLPTWAPTVIGVGGAAALVTLVVCARRLRSQLRVIEHDRLVDRYLRSIERLEADNALLREELAAAVGGSREAGVACCARQGWLHPSTLPGPRSVTSSSRIAQPPA